MVLADYASRECRFNFGVLATDVSTRVLDRARSGIYQESQALPIPHEYRKRFLLRAGSNEERQVRIVPTLRNKVSFHQLNFMDPEYNIRDQFNVVYFRNVMIYFDKYTQATVINKICQNLAPGGYLFAGHSESLVGLDIPVMPVKTSIYRKPF